MNRTAKIIGCGLSGITAAVLLKERGYNVTVFEQRDHIGGNCFDYYINNTRVHKYGPHIFHTNDEEVFTFLCRFTEWFPFKSKVKGVTDLGLISLPYSKKTVKEIGRELEQEEIVDLIFRGYSEKQWGVSFEQIPKSITNRVPKTKDCKDPTWYEGEKYQCLPLDGYTKMMENMLEGIEVKLKCSKNEWKNFNTNLTIYTGKIDEYFDYCYGKLPYRTLQFDVKTSDIKLEYPIINYNQKQKPYTRVYDHSYFSKEHTGPTVITTEYPKALEHDWEVPFYPIPFGDGISIYNQYKELAEKENNVIFLGRLATYKYLDMWMAVKQVFLKLKSIK
jgi:UDP-galactopyranose mutase